MPQITVKLFASFRFKWFKEAVRECPPGTMILDIVTEIGIPVNELGIVLKNGLHATIHDTLQAGDVVSLMPLMGGG